MEHAHYMVLFAGLIFGNNPAANDRSGVRGAPSEDIAIVAIICGSC
jgi:hypothetical protein